MENTEHQGDNFEISDLEYAEAAKKFQEKLASVPLDIFIEWLKLNSLSREERDTRLKNADRDSATRKASSLNLLHPKEIKLLKTIRATLIRRLIFSVHGGGWESSVNLAKRLLRNYDASEADESAPRENQIWWSAHILARLVIAGQDPMREQERTLAPQIADHILVLLHELNSTSVQQKSSIPQNTLSEAKT
jgi:hypothetical protein